MLQLISLWTLTKIFESAEFDVSGKSQMVYLNCFMHHFKDLKPTHKNAQAFSIFKSEIDYHSFEKNFLELHKAGLIQIESETIVFLNHWGQHIDRSKLVEKDDDYAGEVPYYSIENYESRLKESQQFIEMCQRKTKLSREIVLNYLASFVEEQKALSKTYIDFRSCSSHFYYWLVKKLNNTNPQSKTGSTKILGMS